MRRIALACSFTVALSSVSCSFVDDFDKFTLANTDPDGDSGVDGDTDFDAELPPRGNDGGATSVLDAATRDGALPGQPDAGVVVPVPDTGVPQPDAGVGPRCGDGKIDDSLGEKCDDGNDVAGDGCEPKTCTVTPSQICGGVSCNDNDPCTTDVCDPVAGCVQRAIDADKDGYSPGKCKASSGLQGGDCNDANASVHPSAVEACDMLDNDCDGDIDDGAPMLRCYPDLDGDRFANQKGEPKAACLCPMGTIAEPMPLDPARNDCWDDPTSRGEDVFPGQTKYFPAAYGNNSGAAKRSFDYDCDGKVVQELGSLGAPACTGLLNILLCDNAVGFVGTVAPACGETGEYTVCGKGLLNDCSGTSERRTQQCH